MRLLGKIGRLALFLAVCLGVLLYVDYRIARATVMDRLLGLGQRMAPYLDDGRATEKPRVVRINGVPIYVAAGQTPHPPSFVRKWYQDRYAARGDGLDELSQKMRQKGILPPEAPSLNQLAFGDGEKGGVAALDFGQKLSLEALKERLARFAGAGDLGAIARLRYVYYERTGEGGTRFLTVWTDERFNLGQFMPGERRDADGFDLKDVPRYPGTVRVLSAEEQGMPQRMVVYDGPGSADNAQMFYRARMRTLGWAEDETFARLAAREGRKAMRFANPRHEVVLDLSSEDGNLVVCAIETR
jgi:hypothetical protein